MKPAVNLILALAITSSAVLTSFTASAYDRHQRQDRVVERHDDSDAIALGSSASPPEL